MHRILLIDDHPLFLDGLSDLLSDLPAGAQIDGAASPDAAFETLGEGNRHDLCLLDLGLPGTGGFAWLAELADREIHVPVAILSGSDDAQDIQTARDMGAIGFVPKASAPEIIFSAVQALLDGQPWWPREEPRSAPDAILTERQAQVLRLLAAGHPNKRIAHLLDVTPDTVKSHLKLVYERLGVASRTECIARARKTGLI